MRPGPFLRSLFGRHERRISELYRSIYIDMDAFLAKITEWKPEAQRVLEVGCGEGSVTSRLKIAYPEAQITGIDITPRVGRLYRGNSRGVTFRQCNVEEIAAEQPHQFDLVVLSDVLHHVPTDARQGLLNSIHSAVAPEGTFIFKDWERTFTPIHWLGYAADRWLTGDRVNYLTRGQMREILASTFGESTLVKETRVGPWRNNIAILVSP